MSFLPEDITREVRKVAGELSGIRPVGGGCINHGARIDSEAGRYFVKWNRKDTLPGMFDAEARGLGLLAASGSLRIPAVTAVLHGNQHDGLLLEFIESRRTTPKAAERMGRQLAQLHRQQGDQFGLDHDNYMGSLKQTNQQTTDLVDFVIGSRLEPQMKLALEKGRLSYDFGRRMQELYGRLPDLLVPEKPCLIHGDLWSGNYMVDMNEHPVLIDPAVAYGHREMDMAMTILFGGFPDEFYAAYNESFPLAPGYRERLDLYNLYPLLVHVNLFGGGYAAQVHRIVDRFL